MNAAAAAACVGIVVGTNAICYIYAMYGIGFIKWFTRLEAITINWLWNIEKYYRPCQ